MTTGGESKDWSEAATWHGDGLRREVFFFRSGGVELFGSLYAACSAPSLGVLLCNSWGFEGDRASRLLYPLALAVARAGGAAVVFHYPGFGDSHGELGSATMRTLAASADDALREALRRQPCERWVLAGTMLGASIAALVASRREEVERLLLIQPALRPGEYFGRLERMSRRALGAFPPRPGFAYGYPLPQGMLDSVSAADHEVAAALDRFSGRGAVVAHESPALPEAVPDRFERIRVPGGWRFGSKNVDGLLAAAAESLSRAGHGAAA